MAPARWPASSGRVLLLVLAASLLLAAPARALRIVNYNILNYGSSSGSRNVHFRNVLAPLNADVVVVQELTNAGGVTLFLNDVLNTLEPGQWAAASYTSGPNTNNGLFYKPSKVTLLGEWFWLPPDNLRHVNVYRLMPVGYGAEAAEIRVYSQHLKASQGSTNQQRRLTDAISIRDSMNAVPPGTHSLLTGDFNIYSGAEPAFAKFLESQADNDGRVYDPLNAPLITWNTPSLAAIHTQSPCLDNGCPSATGGLDDRFDMYLPTYNFDDGTGLELLANTYIPVGNDGAHYNGNITDSPTIPEGAAYASALLNASDHLPLRVDVQLPAKINVVASLDLGTVIGAASSDLSIDNPAVAPADSLNYSLVPPAGFSAPAGSFALAPGDPAALHAIATTAGAPGPRAGNLIVNSDAVDDPAKSVALTADVLDHAVPSLDSIAVVTADTLDFGQQTAGLFPTLTQRVHNQGYSSVQAQLDVTSGVITGGDGRFSIAGGFSPATVAGTAAAYGIDFDDIGATSDSVYEATLTFQSADEPLPGATPLPSLSVLLRAEVLGGTVGITDLLLPGTTQLFAPFPNPLRHTTTLRFDLAARSHVRLDVFDLGGRRVATVARGAYEPGRYAFQWNGRDDRGAAVGSGLYFIRFAGSGFDPQTTRLAIVR